MDKTEVQNIIVRTKANHSETLDLSNRGITELPDELGMLTHIKVLDLSYNQIEVLPASLTKLKKLENLFLLRNKITEIPSTLGCLSRLKILDVSYNPIKVLPSEIGLLHNLEFLDASYCQLQSLPFELTELLSLKSLNLDENPLLMPPLKVMHRGLYAVMHYLAIEKRKTEASRVVINVFNMPEKIQAAYKQYNSLFSDIVSKASNKELDVDVNFINQDFYQQMELSTGVDTYLMDVAKYISERLNMQGPQKDTQVNQMVFEMRLKEIKEQLQYFNQSLYNKVETIMHIKSEIENLYRLLEGH